MEELQKKFEELIGCSDLNMIFTTDDPIEQQQELDNKTKALAKKCTKLCLESQYNLLHEIYNTDSERYIADYMKDLINQINKLNETI